MAAISATVSSLTFIFLFLSILSLSKLSIAFTMYSSGLSNCSLMDFRMPEKRGDCDSDNPKLTEELELLSMDMIFLWQPLNVLEISGWAYDIEDECLSVGL
jgi:hypothetical protein